MSKQDHARPTRPQQQNVEESVQANEDAANSNEASSNTSETENPTNSDSGNSAT